MRDKKGFTLIELIVVIAVLGVLVLLAAPRFLGHVESAQLVRIQHDVGVMENKMTTLLLDGNDNIQEWEDNKKKLGMLVMQSKLFEKEGVAERVDASHLANKDLFASNIDNEQGIGGMNYSIQNEDEESQPTIVDESYKVIPAKYKKEVNTKLNGTFYLNDNGKVYYEHDKSLSGSKTKETTMLDCPVPLPDYDFEAETGTIIKWHGTETHLVIPDSFKVELDGEETCVPVRVIGPGAFMNGNFTFVEIPESVERIEEDAFRDNELTEVEIPHSVGSIGGNAFTGNDFERTEGGEGNPSESSVVIRNTPERVVTESNSFGETTPTYKNVTPEDIDVIFNPSTGEIVMSTKEKSSSSDKVITIPESISVGGVDYPVTSIEEGAYQGSGLISVQLPSGLERIEDYAFAGNQLIGIVIPNKVNHIGNYAFGFNEYVYNSKGDTKGTMSFVNIKGQEQFNKINKDGDIYENGAKVDRLNGEVALLDHIFVTSIGNHVIDNEYVDVKDPEEPADTEEPADPEPSKPVYMATDDDFSGTTNGSFRYIGTGQSEIEIPHVIKGVPVTSYSQMFEKAGKDITKVVSTNPNVTNMNHMFWQSQATSLDLSSFDTSNVTSMGYMFSESQATTLDLSSFDTSKVISMTAMFRESQTTTLDLSSFDTSNVMGMGYMFYYSQATSLDLSSFDTSNVNNMNRMFQLSQATTLNLSSFDTSKVTNMGAMFQQSKATTGYAGTTTDADKFNNSSDKPSGLTFITKP